MKAVIGSIAFCRNGHLGLVTRLVGRGGEQVARGIRLVGHLTGKSWQSINPTVVGHISDFKRPEEEK